MDLANFDTKKTANVGAKMEVKHPDGSGDVIKDNNGNPWYITVKGADSDTFRGSIKKTLSQMERSKSKNTDYDEAERKNIERTAMCTVDWYIESKDTPIEFSFEKAVEVYTTYHWLKEQVDEFMVDRANFIKG